MARTIQKPGMYCEQCDRPISAQKNKHGFRNASGVVIAYGAWVKVEDWHCPTCGGPAITVADHERNLQFGGRTPSFMEQLKGPAAVAERGDYAVSVEALPKSAKGPKAWGNRQAVSALAKALGAKLPELQERLERLPYAADGMTEPRARGIVLQFERLGGRGRVIAPTGATPAAQMSGGAPVLSAKSPAEHIRELGELKDAGLLTAEEFESKKRQLLDRI